MNKAGTWDIRRLTGSMTVRHPDREEWKFTTGGYVAVDAEYNSVGPFKTRKAAEAWATAHPTKKPAPNLT